MCTNDYKEQISPNYEFNDLNDHEWVYRGKIKHGFSQPAHYMTLCDIGMLVPD